MIVVRREMRKTMQRIAKWVRGDRSLEVMAPSPILEELAAMGVVEAVGSAVKPANIDLAEMVRAKTYARHGHLAYINTFR